MLVYFSVFDDNAPFADPRFPPRLCELILEVFERRRNASLPVGYRHKGPVNITFFCVVQAACYT